MALTKCRECGKEVSKLAGSCPHCGIKNPGLTPAKQALGALVALGIGGLIVYALNSPDSPVRIPAVDKLLAQPDASPGPPISVSALQLQADYEANEVAADAKYKRHRLLVTGLVESINKDIADDIFLMLLDRHGITGAHATMQKDQAQRAALLTKGQRVVLLCTGNGMILTSAVLDDCVFQ